MAARTTDPSLRCDLAHCNQEIDQLMFVDVKNKIFPCFELVRNKEGESDEGEGAGGQHVPNLRSRLQVGAVTSAAETARRPDFDNGSSELSFVQARRTERCLRKQA